MKILAIDTSGPVCSASLSVDGVLREEILLNNGLTHSETIMPAVARIFDDMNDMVRDIDRFAVAAGPGSFTGVRIGVCAVKALAHAYDKACVRVDSLEALAAGAYGFNGVICPILDARRQQVYCAAFAFTEGARPLRLQADAALPLTDFLQALPAEKDCLFTGDAVQVYAREIIQALGERAHFAPMNMRLLRASAVCAIAENASAEEIMAARLLTPLYLRAPQAERERNQRLKEAAQ